MAPISSEELPARLTPQQAAVMAGERAQPVMADRIDQINRGEKVREQ